MRIYDAIMRAADKAQGEPSDYNFWCSSVPDADCGSPACMLGWIGFFAGTKSRFKGINWVRNMDVAVGTLGLQDTGVFYKRCAELLGHAGFVTEPKEAARAMRLYAEKYHGHEKRRSDSELVADLMERVTGSRIPDEAPCNAVSA